VGAEGVGANGAPGGAAATAVGGAGAAGLGFAGAGCGFAMLAGAGSGTAAAGDGACGIAALDGVGSGTAELGGGGLEGSGSVMPALTQVRGGDAAVHCSQAPVPAIPASSRIITAINARLPLDGRPGPRSGSFACDATDRPGQWDEMRLPNIATPRNRSIARASW